MTGNLTDGGEAVLQAFRNLGCDYIMASPGSEWGALWEALTRQKVGNVPGPEYLSCAHETLAVNLAIGYTAITGRMQAVMLHTGVGLLQGAMGIEAALRQDMPMLIVSGEALSFGDDPAFDPGPQWQSLLSTVGGPQRLAEPICKWATQAGSAATLLQQLVSAGELAQRTPSGPVYVNIPIEVMAQPWSPPDDFRRAPPAPKTAAAAADIEAVAEMLVAAECPAIVTEEAGRDPAGYAALVELAETLVIPVVEGRWALYANFPKDHPLHQGFHRPPMIDEADLVLTVGCRAPWYPPSNTPARARIVSIDETPFRTHMVYQPNAAERFLEGNVATTLTLLTEAVRDAGVDKESVEARHARLAAAHDARIAEERAAEDKALAGDTVSPVALLAALSRAAPEGTVFVDETLTHRPHVLRHLRNRGPQSYFRTHGGLGQGLGTALGAKLAAPDRPVVATIGDGSFLYNPVVQALALSSHANLPILIVVFDNGGYQAMRMDHAGYYPDGVAAANDIWLGRAITGFDYSGLVAPFGGFGKRIERPGQLAGAIEEAFAAVAGGRTAILDVVLDA